MGSDFRVTGLKQTRPLKLQQKKDIRMAPVQLPMSSQRTRRFSFGVDLPYLEIASLRARTDVLDGTVRA